MKIQKYFKEMNEIEDISGDYVKVTMSSEQWFMIRMILHGITKYYKYREPLIKAIDNAETKEEWY